MSLYSSFSITITATCDDGGPRKGAHGRQRRRRRHRAAPHSAAPSTKAANIATQRKSATAAPSAFGLRLLGDRRHGEPEMGKAVGEVQVQPAVHVMGSPPTR